ncbi:MAG: hypothetical protein ACO1N4_06750 [Pedobacter sp.]
MKKNLLTLAIILININYIFAQHESSKSNVDSLTKANVKNEIKINLVFGIAGVPEITYERLLNDNSGFGLSIFKALERDIEFQIGFTPHYRIYFGSKKASGFFIEANAVLMQLSEKYGYDTSADAYILSKNWNFGVGAAAGGKFLTKSNYLLELTFGAGRFVKDPYSAMKVYPRGGISIGKRF